VSFVKFICVSLFVLFGAFALSASAAAGPSAGSYDVNVTCGDFSNDQSAAQAYFDSHDQPANLDQNGDGQACADPDDGDFTGGPSAGSYDVNVTCSDFAGDQSASQTYFDANDAPVNLDQNGDGIACNDDASSGDVPGSAAATDATPVSTPGTVAKLPNTGTGPATPGGANTAVLVLLALTVVVAAHATTRVRTS
jgi:hypothetical protein